MRVADLHNKQNDNQQDEQLMSDVKGADTKNGTPLHIAIIGGGLTGLITASLFEKMSNGSNHKLVINIFEKSAGVGRLATRYHQKEGSDLKWQFDFGAQFFTAKSDAFQNYLQPWLDAQVLEPWLARTATIDANAANPAKDIEVTGQWSENQPRYIGIPKMTSFGRALAQSLKRTALKYRTRVAPLTDTAASSDANDTVNQKVTALFDEHGNKLGDFDWVICTAPQAQAIELIENTEFEHKQAIKTPTMLACYSLMLGWESIESLPKTLQTAKWDVLEVINKSNNDLELESNHSPLERVFIEHHKPGRQDVLPSVTVHSSNTWAQANVDDDMESVKRTLLQATKALVDWDEQSAPEHIDCHRWRYASTQLPNVSDSMIYMDGNRQWIVTGDWCDEGRIESCFKVAKQVVDSIAVYYS